MFLTYQFWPRHCLWFWFTNQCSKYLTSRLANTEAMWLKTMLTRICNFKILFWKYCLTIRRFSGDAGDSLMYTGSGAAWYHNGMSFSTIDMDNDISSVNCAADRGGGWWFAACFYASLTCADGYAEWDSLLNYVSVMTSRMMIKVQ